MSSPNPEIKPAVERRELLVKGICAGCALICAGLGAPAVPYLLSPQKGQSRIAWINAGELSDFPPGSPQTVRFQIGRADGWTIAGEQASAWVVNQAAGRVTAFSPACTHLGCLYRWQPAAHEFVCPCHGSRFAIDGAVLAGPASRPLDRYEVRLEGGKVWLRPEALRS